MDTGVFDEDKYFDVFIEYAKADAEDICIKITATIAATNPRRFIFCRPSGFAIVVLVRKTPKNRDAKS